MPSETHTILEQIGQMQRHLAELKASYCEKWAKETCPAGAFDLFVCRARNERYGIPIRAVVEVLPMCRLTDYPQAPPWFSGMLNLRGELIPVLDVSARINCTRRSIQASDFILVVDIEGKRFGLVFREVFGVLKVDGADVRPPMRDVPEALYLLGIVETDRTPVYLLSLNALFGTSEIPKELL